MVGAWRISFKGIVVYMRESSSLDTWITIGFLWGYKLRVNSLVHERSCPGGFNFDSQDSFGTIYAGDILKTSCVSLTQAPLGTI